jgi:hypothetical protein
MKSYLLPFLSLVACTGEPGLEASTPARAAPPTVEAGTDAPASSDAAEPDPPPTAEHGVVVDWTLELGPTADHLLATYSVTNHLDQPVQVCDELVTRIGSGKGARTGRRFIVGQEGRAGPVFFVCGARNPVENPYVLQKPIFASVEAGATLSRTDKIPQPLTAWHNLGRIFPLEGEVTRAGVILDYFVGEPPSWSEITLDGDETVQIPEYADVFQANGELLSIPTETTAP